MWSLDRERQRRGGAEHLDLGRRRPRSSPVGRLGFALPSWRAVDLAGDLEAVLAAQAVGDLLVADHDLDDAAGLAQVDEGDAAVVAAAGHPPGEGDGLADVLGAQGAGVMGADHCVLLARLLVEVTCGRRSSVGGVQVAGSAATCSPDRMSLTSWPPSALVNQTYGMPRRSAYRICLPNFCGAGGDLARDAAGAQRVGDRVARRRATPRRRAATSTALGTGRLPASTPSAISGTSVRETPNEMPTPG